MDTGIVYDLHALCARGDLASIKIRILPRNINQKDAQGRTPLMCAVLGDQLKVGEYLLENKADINKRDQKGWTALMYATFYQNIEWVKLLLNHKASTHLKNSSHMTALQLAQLKGNKEIAEMLDSHKPFRISDQVQSLMYYFLAPKNNHFRDQ